MASKGSTKDTFASAGLILFDAAASYELIAPGQGLDPLRMRFAHVGTWKAALTQAFDDAYNVDYQAVFIYALKVIDTLAPGPVTEAALQRIADAVEYVVSRAGLLRLDLSGRIYHSALGNDLAKSYATFYTSIPAGELLAWLSVDKWDDTLCDFACGSGTLVVSGYHRKLAIAFLQGWTGAVGDLHRIFVEKHLWGFDAMPFASHLTLVNLLLQQPNVTFSDSNVYHVSVGAGKRLGSLDLLKSDTIVVQKRISGPSTGATQHTMQTGLQKRELQVPRGTFDVVIMNPPFTKKQRVTQMLDKAALAKAVQKIRKNLSASGGLPIPFVALGDLSLKAGGRLALVLPSAGLGRDTWKGVRQIITEGYDLEHIMLNWVPGKPAFSEQSRYREVLLVARKSGGNSTKGIAEGSRYTIASHFDHPMDFTEARQIADSLRSIRGHVSQFSIKSPAPQSLHIGQKQIGEAISFPRTILEQMIDNWYRLVSFRHPRLVRQALSQSGLIADSSPPYGFNFASLLSPLTGVGKVGLFVKSVERAGFAVVNAKPANAGLPVLMTSEYDRLTLAEKECKWLVRDQAIIPVEKFTPGSGLLLLPRKSNIYATMSVAGIVCDTRMSGSMWIPLDPYTLQTSDGLPVEPGEVAKIVGLWSQSTFGILTLMFERLEIEGAWSEWLTEAIRERRVLDPRKLVRKQVDEILRLFDSVRDVPWDTLQTQMKETKMDTSHPRAVLDETLARILSPEATPMLAKLREDLGLELDLLSKLMKAGKPKKAAPKQTSFEEEEFEQNEEQEAGEEG